MGTNRPPDVPSGRVTEGLLLGTLGVLGFSFTLPATRIAVAQLDPTVVGLGRAVIAAARALGHGERAGPRVGSLPAGGWLMESRRRGSAW